MAAPVGSRSELPGAETPLPSERPVGTRRRLPPSLALPALAVAAGAVLPFVYLLVRASEAGAAGAWEIATGGRSLELLTVSALLAAVVTASCIALAVPLAWLTVRTDVPARRTLALLTALPLVLPSYIAAYALIGATGPAGLLTDWLAPLGISEVPRVDGFVGAWVVLTLVSYPYVLLPVRATLGRLDPALEEASRSLGRGPTETFLRVVVPQLRPAIGAGGLLVALYTLSDFGAVALMRVDTFTRAIFLQYQASFDRTPAAVLALVLVALCLVILTGEARTRGRGAYHRSQGGGARRHEPARLGRWRWPAAVGCALVVAVALVLPLGVVVGWLVRGLEAGEPLRLAWEATGNSLRASFSGAALTLLAAWPVAYLAARHPGRVAALTERASFTGYALPGVVVALALVFLGARLVPAVYQTQTLLTFAYAVLFLPMAVGALRSSILQVSPSLEEASRALGKGWWGTLRGVVLPLVRPGAVAAFALVFLTVMKELPATLLLAPTGFSTLATQIWNASSEAFFARAAAPALMLVLFSSVPLAVLVAREHKLRS